MSKGFYIQEVCYVDSLNRSKGWTLFGISKTIEECKKKEEIVSKNKKKKWVDIKFRNNFYIHPWDIGQ